ncbi:MAG: hypothetical protein ABIH78_02590 [Candidatus Peregrinibacteria bacterium]
MLNDDSTINLRKKKDDDDDAEFKIGRVEESDGKLLGKVEVASISESEEAAMIPYSKVKVKFDKFVNLVATHAYEEIFDKHNDDDVIISTDLLTDLANAHEEKQDRKMPLMFLIGILLGVGLTWLLLKM